MEDKEPSGDTPETQSQEQEDGRGREGGEGVGSESGEGDGEGGGESNSNETTQRILTIMANFLDGEVSHSLFSTCTCTCGSSAKSIVDT